MDEFAADDEYSDDVQTEKSIRRDIGRIGENIVANEFLWRGFLVTHLDKGTRGVSANADLMIMHPKNREKPLLIQVKACFAKTEPNWIFVGNLTDGVIFGNDKMFNRKNGFYADVLAAVSITNNKNYRVFIIPTSDAEKIVVSSFRKYYAMKTNAGEARKVYPNAYISLRPEKDSKSTKFLALRPASMKILKYEDAFDALTA